MALVAEGLARGLLHLGVDGQLEAGPLRLAAGDGAGEAVVEELVVAPGEQAVGGVLDAATVVTRRKVTCTVGVRRQVADRALIDSTVAAVAADLASSPRVVVRVRDRGPRSVR